MPRVRLRSAQNLVDGSSSIFTRFYAWLRQGERWTHYHASVFAISFFSFAFIHASRKTLSTVKPSLIELWTHNSSGPLFPTSQAANDFLGLLDCSFMFAYAIGLYFGGVLGDRYDPRIVLAIGMWGSAIASFSFGYLTSVSSVYSIYVYFFLWTMSGLFQSVAWPTEISIVGNWFGHGSRGAVMGLWSACASVGNIIGTLISSRLVYFGYEYCFAVNSGLLFLFAFVVYRNLISAPREVGLPEPAESPDEMYRVIEIRSNPEVRPEPINFWRAWLLPGVIPYSLAYACLKLVNYGFFFWLPFYLNSRFKWPESEADSLSTWYDVGGIVAAILAGAASDHFSSRTPLIVVMLLLSTFGLFSYCHVANSHLSNAIFLLILGFFIGGPANMISSSVSADLGKARELRGNSEALSTVTGIVDGTGSFGAAFGQLLIPSIQFTFGWNVVFYGFILMMICTSICLLPLLIKEMLLRRRMREYSTVSSDAEDDDEIQIPVESQEEAEIAT